MFIYGWLTGNVFLFWKETGDRFPVMAKGEIQS